VVEQPPRMEGRQMFMMLAPTAKVAQRARELARQQLAAVAAKKEQAAEPRGSRSQAKPGEPASAEGEKRPPVQNTASEG